MITDVARQSLGRNLTDAEDALAEAMIEIYAAGICDFAGVVDQLNLRRVDRPSGALGQWNIVVLEQELKSINDDLDTAYEREGLKPNLWDTDRGGQR